MITEDNAQSLAAQWVHAWNTHDLTAIMSHYAEDVVLVSPVAVMILNDPLGTVKGKGALEALLRKTLRSTKPLQVAYPGYLVGSFGVCAYANQKGTKTGEFMELDSSGKVVRVVANYNA